MNNRNNKLDQIYSLFCSLIIYNNENNQYQSLINQFMVNCINYLESLNNRKSNKYTTVVLQNNINALMQLSIDDASKQILQLIFTDCSNTLANGHTNIIQDTISQGEFHQSIDKLRNVQASALPKADNIKPNETQSGLFDKHIEDMLDELSNSKIGDANDLRNYFEKFLYLLKYFSNFVNNNNTNNIDPESRDVLRIHAVYNTADLILRLVTHTNHIINYNFKHQTTNIKAVAAMIRSVLLNVNPDETVGNNINENLIKLLDHSLKVISTSDQTPDKFSFTIRCLWEQILIYSAQGMHEQIPNILQKILLNAQETLRSGQLMHDHDKTYLTDMIRELSQMTNALMKAYIPTHKNNDYLKKIEIFKNIVDMFFEANDILVAGLPKALPYAQLIARTYIHLLENEAYPHYIKRGNFKAAEQSIRLLVQYSFLTNNPDSIFPMLTKLTKQLENVGFKEFFPANINVITAYLEAITFYAKNSVNHNKFNKNAIINKTLYDVILTSKAFIRKNPSFFNVVKDLIDKFKQQVTTLDPKIERELTELEKQLNQTNKTVSPSLMSLNANFFASIQSELAILEQQLNGQTTNFNTDANFFKSNQSSSTENENTVADYKSYADSANNSGNNNNNSSPNNNNGNSSGNDRA